ncbi:MAG: cysteine--tRNA ligase [Candidatus Omnitrophica bacterium]|nr:cysteine--tRNA ligase [Candidatus Omnitrophota bacterium]
MKLFNTLSGTLEELKLLRKGEVSLYTCGPTVYDYAHIGNFRTFVFEDLLRRFLEYQGLKVKHVMNITDVDDKTIAGANRDGKKLQDFTQPYIDAFGEDLKTLNILPPNHPEHPPRATEEIKAMVALIEKLVAKKIAYVNDGSVYYRVSTFPNYGKLSKKKLEGNIQGARVDVDEYEKEEAADFALWKKAKEGEPAWDSPWSKGRPGWHIECSAMSMKYLGETFDIHAGGEDLIFPHHENEIAQSEGATGKPFVKYWLHAKHLLVNGEKMSKSKGNFYTLRDLLQKGYDPMAIRYALLSVHYRQQLNFTLEGMGASQEALKRIRDFWYERSFGAMRPEKQKGSGKLSILLKRTKQDFSEALENDLNVPQALGIIFAFIKSGNLISKDEIGTDEDKQADKFFNEVDDILGVFSKLFFTQDIPLDIRKLVEERQKVRKEKDFSRADNLRNQVRKKGFILEDTASGTRVKKLL